ncbi:helix-turn-helix domain-containing protein [Actinospica durhamensis]|uniref:Helix-turn-helix domain-containing protein n=1 Tax=Actinospica durhamensis TaxID=1508375 RepID=A0A941ENX7_9ACTN|nr:helix-turn-helix domain-containing protein [Actinospica durhamensis]MBR7832494.1 helix-turn-helix domain-containing protein [Actinospica durhamensis]
MNESDQLMTIKQLSAYLADTPVQTLYNWRSRGVGPRGIRVGRKVLYRVREVERWLAEQERSAA